MCAHATWHSISGRKFAVAFQPLRRGLVIDTTAYKYSEQGTCNGRASVCLSVRLSVRQSIDRFDSSPAGRRVCCWARDNQSTAVGAGAAYISCRRAQQQRRRSTALSSKCERCRVHSRETRRDKDLLMITAKTLFGSFKKCNKISSLNYWSKYLLNRDKNRAV